MKDVLDFIVKSVQYKTNAWSRMKTCWSKIEVKMEALLDFIVKSV